MNVINDFDNQLFQLSQTFYNDVICILYVRLQLTFSKYLF